MITHIQERVKAMFSDLIFEDRRHLYFVDEKRLPSVSKLVEHHQHPFDENKWLPIIAKRDNVSIHELKHKWLTINQEACDLGHTTHNFLEKFSGIQTPSSPQQIAGIKFFKEILKEYDIVAREIRMYSRKFGYAGTADLLLYHRLTGEYVLADYKTNKDLFKTYGLLKTPFDYLENNPYNHYQLQLSYYQIMLDEVNINISKRLLVYLKADETYKIYELFDFTEYLKSYLLINKAT